MKRVEIVTFICVLTLIVGGTLLTADNNPVSPQQTRAAMAQCAVAAVPAGKVVMTSGGVVATAGVLQINDCTVAAITNKEVYTTGEKVALTIGARNNADEARKIEFLIAVQTYSYEVMSRMASPGKMLQTVHDNWVSLELAPGEEKMTTIVLEGLEADPESDNTFLVYAIDKAKYASAHISQQNVQNRSEVMDKKALVKAVREAQQDRESIRGENTQDLERQLEDLVANLSPNSNAMKYLCGFKMVEPPQQEKPADAYTISDQQMDESN